MLLGLGTAGAACGGKSHATEASPLAHGARVAWSPGAMLPAPDFALAPSFLFPGERVSYRVSLLGVEMAEYSIAVGEPTTVEGRRIIVTEARVRTTGVLARFKQVDNAFTSWIDVAINRSVEFHSSEHEDSYSEDAHSVFAPGEFPVRIKTGAGPETEVMQKTAPGEQVLDLNTMFSGLRGWDAPEGTTATVDAMRSSHLWRMQITVGGFESISTALGEVPTIRYDAQLRRLTRGLELDPKGGERHFSIWITDDESRIPVYLVARTDYGDIKLEIVDYDAGSGQRLR